MDAAGTGRPNLSGETELSGASGEKDNNKSFSLFS